MKPSFAKMIALLALAFALSAGAAVVETTVKPNEPVRITVPASSKATTVDITVPASAAVTTIDVAANGDITIPAVVTSGDDRLVRVRAPASPTTKPIPPPAPAYDVVVDPAGPIKTINDGIRAAGNGTAAKWKTVFVKAATYYGPVRPAGSYVRVIGEQVARGDGTFNRPLIKGTKADVYGLDYVWKGTPHSNLRYEGLRFQGFAGGKRFHADGSPAYLKNLQLIDLQFLDMAATALKAGHGGFLAQVDGLAIEDQLVIGAGFGDTVWDVFVHGDYIQAGCKKVVVRGSLYIDCESFGVQARGPLRNATDPDDGSDPGPLIDGNVVMNAAISIGANGPRATVTNNVGQAGHVHNAKPAPPRVPPTHGQGLLFSYVGRLTYTDNLRIGGPGMSVTGSRMKMVENNPAGKIEDGWEYTKPTSFVLNARNVDAINKSVDLSDIRTRARAGEPVKKLVTEAQARARKAA